MKFASHTMVLLLAMPLACSLTTNATPTLSLQAPNGPFLPGQPVQIAVRMTDLDGQLAAGFQAFIEFDPAELSYFSGSYTSSPFGLQLIAPIQSVGGAIDLASGINALLGQSPTSADATLATLTFISVSAGCRIDTVRFRAHEPPTRLTMLGGAPIVPLSLSNSLAGSCAADIAPARTGNTVVDVEDLLLLIGNWGSCPPAGACCLGDLVVNDIVNVQDLLALIAQWGACP